MLMPNELINSTLSIAIYRSDDIELQTNLRSPDLLIKWGGVDQFANKITVLQRLLALKENKKITVIDLTDPSTPLVR